MVRWSNFGWLPLPRPLLRKSSIPAKFQRQLEVALLEALARHCEGVPYELECPYLKVLQRVTVGTDLNEHRDDCGHEYSTSRRLLVPERRMFGLPSNSNTAFP